MTTRTDSGGAAAATSIVVAVDRASHLSTALELAITLASAQQASLHGLFVEDEDLLTVARLPFTREVSIFGGPSRVLDDSRLQRSLVRGGGEFRKALARQADHRALRWSYSVVRGHKVRMELGDTALGDYVVVGPTLRGRVRNAGLRRIVLWPDGSERALAALDIILTATAAAPGATELLVVEPQADGRGQQAQVQSQAQAQALSECLRKWPQVRSHAMTQKQLLQLLAAGLPRLDALVLPRTLPAAQLQQVLQLADCPVLLVS